MADIVSKAKSARARLAQGLQLLQRNTDVSQNYLAAAEPIAEAMGALYSVEVNAGTAATSAPRAQALLRQALSMMQEQMTEDPVIMEAMEAIAESLADVFELVKLTQIAQTPAPQGAVAQGSPAVLAQPVVFSPAPSAVVVPQQQASPQQSVQGYPVPQQQAYPLGAQGFPQQPQQGFAPGSQAISQQNAQQYQQPQQGYSVPQQQAYPPGAQGFPQQPQQGFALGSQAISQQNAQQYQQPQQGYSVPQQQAYPPGAQGFPQQPQQGYSVPQQQAYPPGAQGFPQQSQQGFVPGAQAFSQQNAQQYQQPQQGFVPGAQAFSQQNAQQVQAVGAPPPAYSPPVQPYVPAPAQPVAASLPYQPVSPVVDARPADAQSAAPSAFDAPYEGEELPVIEAELGAHSQTNFYKGLVCEDLIRDGGLFVSTYTEVKIGQLVKVHVSMPGGYEFDAVGKVQWIKEFARTSTAEQSPPGFGLRFQHISAEARQLVARYVRNREPLFYDDLT